MSALSSRSGGDGDLVATVLLIEQRLAAGAIPRDAVLDETDDFLGLVGDLLDVAEVQAEERTATLAAYTQRSARRYPVTRSAA